MRRVALVLVVAIALLAGSVGSAATVQKATVRISGTGPYWVVGAGWRVRERVVVTVTIGKTTRQRVVVASTIGRWRFTVPTPPSGCDVFFVRARGARSGTATSKRVPSCAQPII